MSSFVKASKAEAKSRIAVTGPSGSGKTFTSLLWATELAEGGKIALIDTERDSAKLYADRFDFDSLSFAPPYNPERLIANIREAEQDHYAVCVTDSLTHFWNGAGGILEMVDAAGARASGNKFSGWRDATPIQQKMVDTMLSFDGHFIGTMRTKTEYTLEANDRGRMAPKKVGMAPIQRDGIEYEFTLVLEMDTDHRTIIGKSRCDVLADRVFTKTNSLDPAKEFLAWLKSGDPLITHEDAETLDLSIRALTAGQRRALAKAWGAKGLGKVNMITQSQVLTARELVAVASTTEDASSTPSTEEVPE